MAETSLITDLFRKLDSLADNADSAAKKSIDKNIIKSAGSTFGVKEKISATLTASERQRLLTETTVFTEQFLKIQQRLQPDTKGKTQVGKVEKLATQITTLQAETKKKGSGLLSLLAGLLGAGFLKKFGTSLINLLKTAFTKFVPLMWKALRGIVSFVGGLITKGLKSISRFIGKAWVGLKRVVGPILKKGLAAAKRLISKIWTGAKSLIVKAFKGITSFLGKLWTGFTGSKAYKAFSGAISTVKNAIIGFFKGIKAKLAGVASSVAKGAAAVVPGAAKTVISAGKGLLSRAGDFVKGGAKVITQGAGIVARGAQEATGAVVKGAKAVGGAILGTARTGIGKAVNGVIKGAGGLMGVMGKVAKLPVIGSIIEGLLTHSDIKKLKEQYAAGEITEDELQTRAGARLISGVTAVMGSAGGAALGGTIGSFVPVVGNLIGGVLGAVAGDVAGRFFGKIISDYLIPKKFTKTMGAWVTGTAPPKGELQDFIAKDGNIIPFSNKDQIMGMKLGGAFDQFFKSGSSLLGSGLEQLGDIGKFLGDKAVGAAKGVGALASQSIGSLFTRGVNKEQAKANEYLATLVSLTQKNVAYLAQIANQKGGQSTPSVSPGSLFNAPDSRSSYYESPYSINASPVMG